jgi:P-type E1-E2 ATPase
VTSWRGDLDAAALAASAEAGSNHPIARALCRHAAPAQGARDVCEELGAGITASVGLRRVLVGSPSWIRKRCPMRSSALEWVREVAERGESPIAVAVDGHVVAVAGLSDPIRSDAAAAIRSLEAMGWDVQLLSGDDQRVVDRVGRELGVTACHGMITPEEKLTRVMNARVLGPVVMAGDGVNDAAAMAAATTSIAVSGSAEIAIEAADVYLRDPSITAIADTARGGRDTLRTIKRSLRFSLVYNVLAGLLAVTGVIHPLMAALLMPLSSGAVLVTSLRSKAFK